MTDPLGEFSKWYAEAEARLGADAEIMALATADREARPSVRMVLYRGWSGGGLRFFTHYESRKGRELDENPRAALLFHWAPLATQVRLEGRVERLAAAESEAYFHQRPRESQLSAAVSPQSRAIASRDELLAARDALERSLDGAEVPRPANWGGYRLIPDRVERWIAGEHRLHHREEWLLTDGVWQRSLLAP